MTPASCRRPHRPSPPPDLPRAPHHQPARRKHPPSRTREGQPGGAWGLRLFVEQSVVDEADVDRPDRARLLIDAVTLTRTARVGVALDGSDLARKDAGDHARVSLAAAVIDDEDRARADEGGIVERRLRIDPGFDRRPGPVRENARRLDDRVGDLERLGRFIEAPVNERLTPRGAAG